MDCETKKQRRRSIRNIRKSACFIPPTLNYGSAWVGENQETNMSNLVQSFEELNCNDQGHGDQPDEISVCSRNPDTFPHANENAHDGFQFTNHSGRSSENFPLSTGSYEVRCKDKNIVSNTELNIHKPLFKDKSRYSKDWETDSLRLEMNENEEIYSSKYELEGNEPQSLSCLYERTVKGSSSDASDKNQDEIVRPQSEESSLDHSRTNGEPQQNNSMSPEFGDFDLDAYSAERSAQYSSPLNNSMNRAMTSFFDISADSTFNMSFSPMESRPDTPKCSMSLPAQRIGQTHTDFIADKQRISDIMFSLEDPIVSSDPDTLLLHPHPNCNPASSTSLSNSASSTSISNSASSVSVDSLMSSMSVSNTASSVSVSNSTCTEAVGSSISSVPVNSSMTSTVCPVLVSNCQNSCSTGELNNTYTLQSSESLVIDEQEAVEDNSMRCFQLSPVKETKEATPECQQSILDSCDAISSNFMIMDFECNMKSKNIRRRSSNFSYVSKPTTLTLVDKTLNSNGEDQNQNVQDSFLKVHDFVDPVIFNRGVICSKSKDPFDITENEYAAVSKKLRNDEQMVVSDTCIVNSGEKCDSISPSRSVLAECGNETVPQVAKKSKQPRRKSGGLMRLIQESTQFLSQPSKHLEDNNGEGFQHDLNKENEFHEDITALPNSDSSTAVSSLSNSRSLRKRPGRRSLGGFRKDADSSSCVVTVKGTCSDQLPGRDEDSVTVEYDDLYLQTIYGKQTFVAASPQPLETVKESASVKEAFSKRRVKRYLKFGTMTNTKEKKRMKKAMSVYKGRQCYFPVAQQDFDRKMLDVQLLLDFDLDCS